jgi:Lamin Tail Domain
MGKILLLILFLPTIMSAQTESNIILNEIMFFPQSGNNEFIELFNTSESESIDLGNYKIKYQTSNPDILESDGGGTILQPKSFAVIFESDYDLSTGIYKDLFPSSALILKIGDNSFGSSGMSNSSDRTISLLDSTDKILETYTYTADNSKGISDEKIFLTHNDSQSNWANCKNVNGTPGFINSVAPLRFDLSFCPISVNPLILFQNNNGELTTAIKNEGTEPAARYSIEIYNDLDNDSSGSTSELIYQNSFLKLAAGDSNTIKVQLNSVHEGDYNLILKILYDADENPENNLLYFHFYVHPPANEYNDIVINEMMYAPLNGEPEWIEIFNKSNSAINLRNWSISDAGSSVKISKNDEILNQEDYLVISKDSSIFNFYSIPCDVIVIKFPSLNNSGDAIVIKDSFGLLIDSLTYNNSWGGDSGKSLERINVENTSIDPSNWETTKDKLNGTPGKTNSVTQKDFDILTSEILFSPQRPLANDNVYISVKIMNVGKNDAAFFIKLFEDTNLDSLADILINSSNYFNLSPGDSILIPVDYVINNLQTKKGFVATAVFSPDQDISNNSIYSLIKPGYPEKAVVINEIMYNPSNGEPEWIELFNNTNNSIDLSDWAISDVITTPVFSNISGNNIIKSKSYLVISRDSSILSYHRNISSNLIITNLPVLNNDADGVVLKDDEMFTIDSVFYRKEWGGKSGSSIERISFETSSNIASNWGNSIDIELSTPGRINSIKPKNYDLAITALSFIPRFPIAGENVFLCAKIKNNGTATAVFNSSFYFDSDSDNKPDHMLSSKYNITVNSSDSVIVISGAPINDVTTEILTAAKINYQNDEDTLNNYFEKFLIPGIKQNAVLINEVMYSPSKDEPEWIELVNVSQDTLNLKNWMIGVLLPKLSKSFISADNLFLYPGEYFVIARDTSFFYIHPEFNGKIKLLNFETLGNTEDGIIIYDFREGIIDSLKYSSLWGGIKGYSIERISLEDYTNDSTNWSTCLSENKSTPGLENSLTNIRSYRKDDLVINEIMFDPDINNGEFVEFYNCSNSQLNIGGWKIEDGSGKSYKLSNVNFNLSPSSFFVLASDSQIFNNYDLSNFQNVKVLNSGSLGLSKDERIILKDMKGNLIDSVLYNEKWHNRNLSSTKNISIEKINPGMDGNYSLNWSSSVDLHGATPGKINSIFSENKNMAENISVSPNPFSPDNDGFEDFTIINYSLSEKTSQVRIKIFDNRGRLLRTLLNNQPSGSKGTAVFNGLEDNGTPFRMGIYIVLLEALNETSGVSETLKTVVVVARKL